MGKSARKKTAVAAILLLAAGLLLWLAFGARRAPAPKAPGAPAKAAGPALAPLSETGGGGFTLALGRDSVWVGSGQGPAPGPRKKSLDQVGNLSYMAGYRPPPPRSGVLVYDPGRAMPGVNLCLSAHKASAALIDMGGRVLHEWTYDHALLPEEQRKREYAGNQVPAFFRTAAVLPGGGLLAVYDYRGLIKLDRDSNLLWYRPNGAHHDFLPLPGGGIAALAVRYHVVPRWNRSEPVADDLILFLDSEGNEREGISIAECFENSPWAGMLKERAKLGGDLFHANKIQILDGSLAGKDPAFAAGNILVSLREVSALAVLDPRQKTVVKLLTGGWKYQHESRLLPDGRLILLDNLGYGGNSRVMEIDPLTGKEAWEYHGDPPQSFRTLLAGDLQRLQNGDTLVTDTMAGRSFELAPGGGIVWEYVNPHRVRKSSLSDGPPPEGPDEWFVAALFKMQRLPPDFSLEWVPGSGAH